MMKKISLCLLSIVMIVLMIVPVYASYSYERNRTGTYYEENNQYSIDVVGSIQEDTNSKINFKVVPKKDYVLVKNIDYDSSVGVDVIHVEISKDKNFRKDRCIIASGTVSGGFAYDKVKIDVSKKTTKALSKGKKYYIRAYASQRVYTKDKKLWVEFPNIETMKVKSFTAK